MVQRVRGPVGDPRPVRVAPMAPRVPRLGVVMVMMIRVVVIVVAVHEERVHVIVVAAGVAVRDHLRAGNGRRGGEGRQHQDGDVGVLPHRCLPYHAVEVTVTDLFLPVLRAGVGRRMAVRRCRGRSPSQGACDIVSHLRPGDRPGALRRAHDRKGPPKPHGGLGQPIGDRSDGSRRRRARLHCAVGARPVAFFTMRRRACFLIVLAMLPRTAAFAHEHMYIASAAPGSGALELVGYDFTRAFPVAQLPNAPDTWIGVDPSFNSLMADDPTNGAYQIKKGRKIKMVLTAIDPELSVVLNGKTLRQPGDVGVVGKMPYLHQHPQWTLTIPPGSVGTFHVSFKVKGAGYVASPVYTGTVSNVGDATTTTLPGSVTTTTVPSDCTVTPCNDGNPCTTDVCDAGTCRYDPVTDADAVLCRLEQMATELNTITASGSKQHAALVRLYRTTGKARAVMQAAASRGKPSPRAGRLVSRLTQLTDAADRVGLFVGSVGDEIRTLASTAYDAFALWRASRG